MLTVSDTGTGMSPASIARLFRFSEHLSTSGTGGEKGSGLGLHLCKEMIDRHGGTLSVESTEGEGSHFHVRLPAAV